MITKIITYVFLSLVIYFVYIVLIKPLLFRRKFAKYSNVHISPTFIPLLGDMKSHLDSMNAGKVHYDHLKERAEEIGKYDLKVKLEGVVPYIHIISKKAVEEFLQLQPIAIDKQVFDRGVGKFAFDSFMNRSTTSKTKDRRKNFSRWMNLNSSSAYIPNMLGYAEKHIEEMAKKDKVELTPYMNILTFLTISGVLFGKDFESISKKRMEYINSEGKIQQMDLLEMLITLTKDVVDNYYNPVTSMLPFLNTYNLVNPFKRCTKNLEVFKTSIGEFLKNSKDLDCVSYKLLKNENCSFRENLDDLAAALIAGTETTSHSLMAFLYYMQKNPEIKQKLITELTQNGLVKGEGFKKNMTLDNIQNLGYLNSCVKEVLRIDSPVIDTFDYQTFENVRICNVPIQKGIKLKVDIYTAHFDSSKWASPREFIPERHDVDSDFFKKSKDAGIVSDVYSRRTFGHGLRSCPGMSLALLEIKVFMIYFLTHAEVKFEEEDIHNEGIGFGLGSHFEPKVSVRKL